MSDIVSANWNYPTPIWFGASRINDISLAIKELKMNNPLIVTDPQFLENVHLKKILLNLDNLKLNYSVF